MYRLSLYADRSPLVCRMGGMHYGDDVTVEGEMYSGTGYHGMRVERNADE